MNNEEMNQLTNKIINVNESQMEHLISQDQHLHTTTCTGMYHAMFSFVLFAFLFFGSRGDLSQITSNRHPCATY